LEVQTEIRIITPTMNILAIIGRPNVGKSTLFNRIVGERHAIVHDDPGVTRDRHYALADWAGKIFTVIDTGGYVPESTDVFERAIREQALMAIEEADAVLFMVDAISGITPLDVELAKILRRAQKKIFLIVNKVDSETREPDVSQFYRLGLNDPLPISALGGRKIGDFLDAVTASFPTHSLEDETDVRLKIAIIGKPNVGKSSFVNALLGKPRNIVTDVPGTTRDSIDSVVRYQHEEVVLIDTAGLRRRSRIKENVEFYSTLRALKSIDRCDVAVLMADAAAGIDKQDLRILETTVEKRCGVIIAVNKWDLIEKDDLTAREFEKAIKKFLRNHDFVPVIFISALTKQRIFKVIDLAKDVFSEKIKRIETNQLNKFLLREIEDKPPSSKSGREIRIKYVTQVKVNPPAFSFFVNVPSMIEESYRKFLEGRIRRHFGFKGVPLKIYFKKKN
jgi:GTPase